jgi:hypothetical protein
VKEKAIVSIKSRKEEPRLASSIKATRNLKNQGVSIQVAHLLHVIIMSEEYALQCPSRHFEAAYISVYLENNILDKRCMKS